VDNFFKHLSSDSQVAAPKERLGYLGQETDRDLLGPSVGDSSSFLNSHTAKTAQRTAGDEELFNEDIPGIQPG
jgi:hypothetical protein